jgi:hypothetical protein
MKRIFGVLVITALLGCGQGSNSALKALDSKLINTLQSDSTTDAYKACIFLGEIALNEQQIARIETSLPASTCKFYLLAKRVGSPQNITDFIEHFPNSKKQKEIWHTHSDIGYPIQFTPPYIGFLAVVAITSDPALDKLVATLNYTDAAHAEAMVETLARLYVKHRNRVATSLVKNKIPNNLINLIIKTSRYFSKE